MSENLHRTSLDNGVRLLVQPIPGARSVSASLWLVHGSRHEAPGEGGMTHFAEHLLFKGVPGRGWRELAREMNLLGGQFNASTSTDWVKLYTQVVRADLPEALALLATMFLRSEFPTAEVDRERDVILEEIAEYEDVPEDQCYEAYTQALLLPHPAGRPVIGTPELVSSYTRDQLLAYWHQALHPARLVLSVAGDVDPGEVTALARQFLGHLDGSTPPPDTLDPIRGKAETVLIDRDLEQINFCFGVTGPTRDVPRRYAWVLYDAILGGGMGSRLFNEVREKRGMAYSIASGISLLANGGYLTVSGSTRPETIAEVIEVSLDEIGKLSSAGPTTEELATAKRQLARSFLLALDSIPFREASNAEREIYGSGHLSPEEVLGRLEGVTAGAVQEVAGEVIEFGQPALALVGPLDRAGRLDFLRGAAHGAATPRRV